MTSNVGTAFATKAQKIGFQRALADIDDEGENSREIEKSLKKTFRPEFLNRVDEIIIFNDLRVENVERIVDLQMSGIAERLAEQGLKVELTDAARRWLAREGFDPQFGARPLRRALQRHIESPLSVELLRNEYEPGDLVCVDADEDGLVFTRMQVQVEAQAEGGENDE
jgi:ATP-dependent Clp protease ATP-binding subunit ClpC